MNAFFAQFNGLNMNDPGSWPAAPKVILLAFLFVALLFAAYLLDWQGQMEELQAGAEKEAVLKQEYVEKKSKAINLELYRKRLIEIDASFGTQLRQLPDKSEVDRLVVDINQAGTARGLQFELFRPALEETKKEFYAELPISVRVVGDYHKLGSFASDIAQLSRIVTLNDMSLKITKDGLVMEAVAKTFRYLDEAEVAEQKKAAAEAKKKASGGKSAIAVSAEKK